MKSHHSPPHNANSSPISLDSGASGDRPRSDGSSSSLNKTVSSFPVVEPSPKEPSASKDHISMATELYKKLTVFENRIYISQEERKVAEDRIQ